MFLYLVNTVSIWLCKVGALPHSNIDHAGICPSNPSELVTRIISRLDNLPSSQDAAVQLCTGEVSFARWPCCSLMELLLRYLDVSAPPSTTVLEYLINSTIDQNEKHRLRKLVNDREACGRWLENYWPTLLTALNQFPNSKPDAATLCSLLPKIQARFYSVSSTPMTRSDELQLTVSVVQFLTQNDGKRYGLCSNYLNEIPLGTMLPCFVRRLAI